MKRKVVDVCSVNPGADFSVGKREYIHYLDTASVCKNRIETVQRLQGGFPSRAQRTIRENDILISSVRPNLEHNCFVRKAWENMVASTGFIHVRVNDCNSVVPEFLYYYLTCPKRIAAYSKIAETSQSSYPSFNKDVIEDVCLPACDFSSQKKIGKFLSSVDRLIELSRKRIENLEKLAKEIYDYWFVQFDFPDKNGRPYKTSGGKMVYNAVLKREIPDGWEVAGIEDVCSVVDCLHSKKPDFCHETDECYLLTLENLTKNGYVDLKKKFYISRADYDEWTRNIEVSENDFVITNAGRAGDICRVRKGVACAAGRNMTVVRPNGVNPYYLRGYFFSDFMQMQIMGGLEMGSLFANFNVRTIRKLNVIVPQNECKAIESCFSCLEGIVRLIDMTLDGIDELTQLREFLLPLLMNGQAKMG